MFKNFLHKPDFIKIEFLKKLFKRKKLNTYKNLIIKKQYTFLPLKENLSTNSYKADIFPKRVFNYLRQKSLYNLNLSRRRCL